jgi:hypothetical protein
MARVPFVSDAALELTGICRRVGVRAGLEETLKMFRSLPYHEVRWIVTVAIENLIDGDFLKEGLVSLGNDLSEGALSQLLVGC